MGMVPKFAHRLPSLFCYLLGGASLPCSDRKGLVDDENLCVAPTLLSYPPMCCCLLMGAYFHLAFFLGRLAGSGWKLQMLSNSCSLGICLVAR
ncbi:hypothetical protein ACFX19_029764 [Malus domestica]